MTHGHSFRCGAQALGVSRRMLAYYLSGEKPIPRRVGLAMTGWSGIKRAKALAECATVCAASVPNPSEPKQTAARPCATCR